MTVDTEELADVDLDQLRTRAKLVYKYVQTTKGLSLPAAYCTGRLISAFYEVKQTTVAKVIQELKLPSDSAKMYTFYQRVSECDADEFPWRGGEYISWRKMKPALKYLKAELNREKGVFSSSRK
jgi:hypothetical protein